MDYRITLPDGSARTRRSFRRYTHGVAACAPCGNWWLVGFALSLRQASAQANRHLKKCPEDIVQVLPVDVSHPPLSAAQFDFLSALPPGGREIHESSSAMLTLRHRGLIVTRHLADATWFVIPTAQGLAALAAARACCNAACECAE